MSRGGMAEPVAKAEMPQGEPGERVEPEEMVSLGLAAAMAEPAVGVAPRRVGMGEEEEPEATVMGRALAEREGLAALQPQAPAELEGREGSALPMAPQEPWVPAELPRPEGPEEPGRMEAPVPERRDVGQL